MGGDLGPSEVVKGILQIASEEPTVQFTLVGDESILTSLLPTGVGSGNIVIIPASEVIEMHDQPSSAIRQKKNASIVVAVQLLKQNKGDALVSIGNTGAAMAVSLLTLGRIKGIDRPAIALVLPTLKGHTVMLDVGATVDCDPRNLYEFALMGSIYATRVLEIKNPTVALLSIGEESAKGNDLVKRTHALLRDPLTPHVAFKFAGNIEGREVYHGTADVVVCDGFIGNVFLKTSEGVAELIQKLLKEEVLKLGWRKIFAVPLKPAFAGLKSRTDYDQFGGAPLLGIDGICIIGHGRSNARAVANACRVAIRAVRQSLVGAIKESVASIGPVSKELA